MRKRRRSEFIRTGIKTKSGRRCCRRCRRCCRRRYRRRRCRRRRRSQAINIFCTFRLGNG